MPGLDRSIVEHRLPMKYGFWPHQQPARRCNPNILPDIKAEITKLNEANFIRQCRYAEWISNVLPVYKKNGSFEFALISGILLKLRRWMVCHRTDQIIRVQVQKRSSNNQVSKLEPI